jgi:Transcriptional regulator, AbiEi antitoxin
VHSRDALLAIARYAKGQWGMVTSAQATAAGVNYMQLKRMTEAGLLERIGPGVYLMIGGQAAASRNRAYKVAWLRLDPAVPGWERPVLGPNSAVVSHGSAAVLLQLGDLVVHDVEFIVTRRRTSRDPAVKLHNRSLASYEVTWADGLPVTTATRTLTDLLAAGIPAGNAGSFLAEALDRRMLNVGNVIDSLAPFAAAYGCKPGDGEGLVELLLNRAPGASGVWDREQTVADLARELLKLSDAQLRSLRSLASAAKEPAIAALLSRIAQDLSNACGVTPGRPHTAGPTPSAPLPRRERAWVR